MLEPGRFCPADYRYSPASFARAPGFAADTLYVVGGLYGNVRALDAIEELASCEVGPLDIVFNGDFHWFDATSERFAEVSAHGISQMLELIVLYFITSVFEAWLIKLLRPYMPFGRIIITSFVMNLLSFTGLYLIFTQFLAKFFNT